MSTETLPTENSNTSGRLNESSQHIKSNTIIVRCPESVNQSVCNRFCTMCLKTIDPEYYFLWEFMEFCNVLCISKFQGLNFKCIYCSRFINNTLFGKFYIRIEKTFKFFCCLLCMDHYKLTLKYCSCCQRAIIGNFPVSLPLVREGGVENISFCSEVCCDMFNTIAKPPKIPSNGKCCVCKQNKSVAIVLKHDGMSKYFCAKRCLIAYSFVKIQAGTEQCTMCLNYFSQIILEKLIVYYENLVLIFCSTSCQSIYMLLNGKMVCCSWCQNKRNQFGMIRKFSSTPSQNIYICSVYCFKLYECAIFAGIPPTSTSNIPGIITSQYAETDNILVSNINVGINENFSNLQCLPFVENKQIVVHTKKSVDQRNVATMCFIPKANKDVTVQPDISYKQTQTDAKLNKIIFPIPVPLYVPTPMAMYSIPIPTAVPFLLPIPVPIFVPVPQQSFINIENQVQTTCNKIPNNPYEAELLKIADVIANDKAYPAQIHSDDEILLEHEDATLKESTSKTHSNLRRKLELNNSSIEFEKMTKKYKTSEKAQRKQTHDNLDLQEYQNKYVDDDVACKSINKISLNSTLGIEALQHWARSRDYVTVRGKNIFKIGILKMLPDKLCLILDSFIRNLKKPDGSEYAPDTIYYLCLGIQYYLSENGRTDNIFLDKSYNKFNDTLNEFAEKFSCCHPEESQFIVTRVEEEHLWETKQLGHCSPQVVLNTLVFFNTKYYHCSTVEQHLDISFSKILKLWRKKGKSKSLMLRFHPKTSNPGKRVYEQYADDETDPARCPIKLYEFYLSKCPESVKSSSSVFYLQPEQYCTSDSPLWYMSSPLSKDDLVKMINRVKMVKEINVALLIDT